LTTDKIIHLIAVKLSVSGVHVLNLLSSLMTNILQHPRLFNRCSFAGAGPKKGIFTASFPMRHPLDLTLLPALTGWLRKQNASSCPHPWLQEPISGTAQCQISQNTLCQYLSIVL